MSSAPTRILLVDDHPTMRKAIRGMLASHPEAAVAAEAGNGAAALQLAGEMIFDVILLDINLPDMDGLHAAKRLLEIAPGAAIIVLSLYDDPGMMAKAEAVGAKGYVCKSEISRDLVPAIHAVSRDQSFFKRT